MEGSVTFKDCTVNVKNTNTEGSALKGLNGLTQSFSFINTHFTAQTAGTDVIREISDIRYYGCFMKTPAQGFLAAYNVLWSPDGAVNRLEIVPGKDNIEPFLYYGDTPKATAITNKTATIEFYGALDNFTYSKDIKYHVFLAKGPLDGTWDKSYDPDFIPSGSKLSTVITGLEEGTKYTLRMRAMDQNKNYTFYKDIEFTTSINEAPTLPENISLRWTCEGTTINVEWDPATDDFTPANKLTYWVEYKEVNQDSWYMKNVGNATSYTIEGLKPNTDYIVCVCVVDEDEKYTRYRAFMETTGDDPNAIDHVADATSATGKAYNLNGTPAGKNQRGVVIKNGKKIIQK